MSYLERISLHNLVIYVRKITKLSLSITYFLYTILSYFYKVKSLKKILDFYVFSNLHVGFATACFVLLSEANFSGTSVTYTAAFVFFSTVFTYHFIRVFESCDCTVVTIIDYLKKQRIITLLVAFIGFIGMIVFGCFIGVRQLWILIPAAFITFWFAIPLFKHEGKRVSLRNYPTLKIMSIALVWSISTVLFPLQESLGDIQVWLAFVQRFFLVMALVIPFDIRDMHKDAAHLQTLPQMIGIGRAKKVGMYYLVIFFVLSFFKFPLDERILIPELIVFVISLLLVAKTQENRSKYYAAFWVESVPIIWLIAIWSMDFIL